METLNFQILSWTALDYEYDDPEEDHDDPNKYLVKIFGNTENGESVSVNLLDYTPFFFIKVCHRVDKFTATKLRDFLVEKLPFRLKTGLLGVAMVKKKDFWGFTNNELCYFARFKFKNLKTFRQAIRIFERKVEIPAISREAIKYKLYESNIEPFLRLMHIQDIEPCGWVKIEMFERNNGILPTHCKYDLNCNWKNISRISVEKIAPFKIASFDLECTSSHGDFPVPKKNYKKLAYEVVQYFEGHKHDDGIKDTIFTEIMKVFDHDPDQSQNQGQCLFSKVYPKSFKGDLEARLEIKSKLEVKLKRIMDDIFTILTGKLTYKGATPATSKDIALKALTAKFGDFDEKVGWTGIFPPLEGDPIIQIGTTVHKYGERDCYRRVIMTLGTCDEIEDAEVIPCENEKELLLKWRDLIVDLDPDVMTGYNIFGFDMSYLYDRSKELGIMNDFCKIGRLVSHRCEYVEKSLSSSALGDNLLKYIEMEGRVLIDVMKVVQRDHKLDSYKLDNVANHFMKMNKHDVHPSDIFRLQKGSSADRKVISEYCLQDCALCNKLIMKLEIMANNIGMANVCNVPFSYIFMRGQGIKIFSLVAKECRADDFIIPTIMKSKFIEDGEETQEDEDGYEGAIVLEPKVGIYIDAPIAVLDYASLYPSSMISENLSHDSIVLNPKYDNLPGYEYLDIKYDVYEKIDDKKVRTGEKTVRFVQFPNGEKGTIPKILMKLLRQRKETRKKIEFRTIITNDDHEYTGMVKEKEDTYIVTKLDGSSDEVLKENTKNIEDTYDEFQKAVLDGLQLAYKVTANSLYGQCGAKTSPIYLKEIAACTTATGRNQILKVKKFIEDEYKDADVVYGDSVTGDTPLLVRYLDNTIDIVTIETIINDDESWKDYRGFKIHNTELKNKEQAFIDAEVWTNGQWTKIKRVIRHYTNKKLYRVSSYRGSVDVTEDHSLIDINGEKIKPLDCEVEKTKLMHSFPEEFPETVLLKSRYTCDKYYKAPVCEENNLVCKTCGETKATSEFYYHKKKNGGGYFQGSCKLCAKMKNAKRQGKVVDSTKILTKVLNYDVPAGEITKEEAWVWGFFFGDGSCGHYVCNSGIKRTWAINNSNTEYLNKAKEYLLMTEPSNIVSDFKILDTIDSSAVYKLAPVGSAKYMVEKYRALFYDKDKYKKVPKIILNASKQIKEWFLDGYLTADGAKKEMETGGLSFACKGKIGAQGLYYIAKSIGWDHLRIYVREYKDNTYWIRYTKTDNYYEENKDKLYNIIDLEEVYERTTENAYVYDLETEYGKFHSGVGELIVANTDSCMVQFNPRDPEGNFIKGKAAIMPTIRLAQEASKRFKPYLKPPHDAEYEKTFYPFILFSKKRYCANKYEFDDEHCKMTSMGIALKRRDNAQIVKKIYGGVLDIILNEQDIGKSITFLRKSLNDLISNAYPIDDLVITKSLRADYKDPEKIAHKVLAERMGERDPGNKPQVNDRIPFVYVQVPEKKGEKILQGNRIETPDYIKSSNLKPDYEFYITNQVMKPILQLYALILENLDGYNKGKTYYDEMYKKLLKEKEGDIKKAKDRWNDLREDEVKKLLFDPVLIKLKNKRQGNREITDFFPRAAH